MRLRRAAGLIALALLAIPGAACLIVAAINRNDRPIAPSAARLLRFASELPQVPNSENGYVFLMGFDAKRDEDPFALGARRLARLRRLALLAVGLRTAQATPAAIEQRVARAALPNPYDGKQFEWDDGAGSLVFIGLEPEPRGRHAIVY